MNDNMEMNEIFSEREILNEIANDTASAFSWWWGGNHHGPGNGNNGPGGGPGSGSGSNSGGSSGGSNSGSGNSSGGSGSSSGNSSGGSSSSGGGVSAGSSSGTGIVPANTDDMVGGHNWEDDTSGGSGGGSAPPPPQAVALNPDDEYIVVGNEALCTVNFDYEDKNNQNVLEKQSDGSYKKVYSDVAPGEYMIQVAQKGSSEQTWGDDGYNDDPLKIDYCNFEVKNTCEVTVIFYPGSDTIRVEGEFVESEDLLDSLPIKNSPDTSDATEATEVIEATTETTEATAAESTEATEASEVETTAATIAVVEENVDEGGLGGGVWMFACLGLLIAFLVTLIVMLLGKSKREKKQKEAEQAAKKEAKRLQTELAAAKAAAERAAAQAAAAQAAAQEPLERTELRDGVAAAAAVAAPINVVQPATGMRSAVFQGLGARKDQQDSYGMTDPALYGQQGIMAIVADGMGGLANGKAVSSALVNTFLGGFRGVMNYDKPQDQLMDLLIGANQRINQMLAGAERSGSTLLSVIIRDGRMHFLTVGDSRIYLYRSGALLQLNREHIYQEELALKAANRQVHLSQVTEDRQAHSLTSFIGIGNLTHMDRNFEGIRLVPGDRVMLCSDGVFGTLTQEQMEYALSAEDVKESARLMRDMIVDVNKPYQDNNTGLILEYLG